MSTSPRNHGKAANTLPVAAGRSWESWESWVSDWVPTDCDRPKLPSVAHSLTARECHTVMIYNQGILGSDTKQVPCLHRERSATVTSPGTPD